MSKTSFIALVHLKSLAEGIEKNVKELKAKLSSKLIGFASQEISQLKNIIKKYNSLRSELIKCSSEHQEIAKLDLPYISEDFLYLSDRKTLKVALTFPEIGEAFSTLNEIEIECHALIDALEALLKPQIPFSITTQLGSLREELKKLEKDLEVEVSSNIEEAINEIECGHNLAATLIASRVIRYVLDKIPGENEEEKVKKLIESGKIEKGREDELKIFLRASKLSRNFLSHRIDLFPKPEEALQIVSSAISFARYLTNIS
jgi:hypothetical protein